MVPIVLVLMIAISLGIDCSHALLAQETPPADTTTEQQSLGRTRYLLNDGWRFFKYSSADEADDLIYDVRPTVKDKKDDRSADTEPTDAERLEASDKALKPWVLPSGNAFIADPAKRHTRPKGNPGSGFPFVKSSFDDSQWQLVDLPHDWAIKGPFMQGWDAPVTGGMGRLPSPGVAWYRRSLDLSEADTGKSIFLDIDGAMSYAIVWLNGNLVGGWPFGYTSFRLDLTPYVNLQGPNQLAIRLDNPPHSSRWYPGGGIYRNVWLTKTHPIHVGHWGTFATTTSVNEETANVELSVTVDNDSQHESTVSLITSVYEIGLKGSVGEKSIAQFEKTQATVSAGGSSTVQTSTMIKHPKLWGPPPTQTPNRYIARTQVIENGQVVDTFETPFGIRTLKFDPDQGVLINGEHIHIKGANQHHDLGALGAAFNVRAAERQLELLREMGCNAIRLAHNPPAPELLDLTDRMGFVVVDELYDVWVRKKTPLDFHLIYPDWHEPDLRALIRRDRNHPSIIMWSLGNEVGEQYTGAEGAKVAAELHRITKSEDTTRPTAASMNYAKAHMELPAVLDTINLNYQGEGIRDAPAYKHLSGIKTAPAYPAFHEKHPNKLIISSENAAAVSSRGVYLFPVTDEISAPVSNDPGGGGDPDRQQVSSYDLYSTPFGSSADKVFGSLQRHPFVAGGFVWSGWDYLGEPTPYYGARSSYFGVVDLAGFKKDRFYLYQSHWRPEHPMVHILPHWTWPERVGKVTPVHVFTSGDEVELFLNGVSLGRKRKQQYQYRLRWDDVVYEPGVLKAVAYKNGDVWATETVETAGKATALEMVADRDNIQSNGLDLSFITARVIDSAGHVVPRANHELTFLVEGPGEIIATDNGDPTCFVAFPSPIRPAFNGLALAIVRATPGQSGKIQVTVSAKGLADRSIVIGSE
ncbi:MAG: beta-galactosidase GalB [Rhodopirellula sp. JB044]|uniref:beta-galactosidase GalB n=1 Tax=Rhodopirellula sp. JB044 TaxID=3342844 RepID=UPI00370B3F7B